MRRPSAIKGRWIKVWNHGKVQLVDRGDWNETTGALLERFVLNLVEADNALTQAAAEPFTAGSMGQLVAHPGFNVSRGCEAAALAAARQLMLTPATKGKADDVGDGQSEADPLAALDELAAKRAAKRPA